MKRHSSITQDLVMVEPRLIDRLRNEETKFEIKLAYSTPFQKQTFKLNNQLNFSMKINYL